MIGVVGRVGWSAGLGGRADGWSGGWVVELVGGRRGVGSHVGGQVDGWSGRWLVGQVAGGLLCDGWI